MYVWGQEAYGLSLYPPLNFAENLKQFLEKESLFKMTKTKNLTLTLYNMANPPFWLMLEKL